MRRRTYTLYLANLNLPRVIQGPGLYVTRSGEVVTVERLGDLNQYMAYGQYPDGVREGWMVSGRVLPFTLSQNDIVKALEN